MNARKQPLESLVKQCIQHLQTELSALRCLETRLLDVRTALQLGQIEQLKHAVDQQDKLSKEIVEVQSLRASLQQQIAGTVEGATTVRNLARLCERDEREKLMRVHSHLDAVRERVRRLVQSNLIVIVHGLQLLDQVWVALMGDQQSFGAYESSGKAGTPLGRPIFETQC